MTLTTEQARHYPTGPVSPNRSDCSAESIATCNCGADFVRDTASSTQAALDRHLRENGAARHGYAVWSRAGAEPWEVLAGPFGTGAQARAALADETAHAAALKAGTPPSWQPLGRDDRVRLRSTDLKADTATPFALAVAQIERARGQAVVRPDGPGGAGVSATWQDRGRPAGLRVCPDGQVCAWGTGPCARVDADCGPAGPDPALLLRLAALVGLTAGSA